jgi:SPFH domain/Band 7 family protein
MKLFLCFGTLVVLTTLVVPFSGFATLAECDLDTGTCEPVPATPTPEPQSLLDTDPFEGANIGTIITYLIIGVVAVVLCFSSVFVVNQQTAMVIERPGRCQRVASAGLNFKGSFFDRKAGALDLHVQQMNLQAETKTKDNVFVVVSTSLQFTVLPDKNTDGTRQMTEGGFAEGGGNKGERLGQEAERGALYGYSGLCQQDHAPDGYRRESTQGSSPARMFA